jgi:DNA adenine methylase
LKWAGGKGQLLETFRDFYPKDLIECSVDNYYEPFLGGGAVFFDVAAQYNIKSAFLYDVNEELILAYRVVQQDANKLIEHLEDHQKKYIKLDENKQAEYFYNVRKKFNSQRIKIDYENYSEKWISRAAHIIFLNKTCFNGLFRFNSKGEFNTPKGRYRNPKILDADTILKTSQLLAIAEIKKTDFREIERDIKPQSFVYYDPPYRPLNKTSSFTSYSKIPFTDSEQTDLAALFQRLNGKGILQMLSNSDPKNVDLNDNFFDELYSSYSIFRVPAKRMINSNGAKRSAINEIIVTNYKVDDY